MRRKIKWNTVFFWSMILVLAFLICNQKTIIREGFREGAIDTRSATTDSTGNCIAYTSGSCKTHGRANLTTVDSCAKCAKAVGLYKKPYNKGNWGSQYPKCTFGSNTGFNQSKSALTAKSTRGSKGGYGYFAICGKSTTTKKKAAKKLAPAKVAEVKKVEKKEPVVKKKEAETKKAQAADEKEGVKLPSGTTTTKKERKARPPAKGGSGPGLDVDFGGDVAKWKITTGQGGNLEFQRDDKTVASFGNDGLIKGNKCSCGYWKLRDSRAGIPGRGDMNLHTDGWLRMLDYGSPEVSEGKHKISEYKKGGFSGKQLYYLKGGKDATLLG